MRLHFIQHVPFEHPAHLLKWTTQKKYSFSITKIYEGELLPPITDFDLLVIMGGPMGAYDEHKFTWLKTEKQFIKDAILANKKVFGICLGAQLIANVLEAKVYPHTQKEIGWWPVKKIAANKDHPLIKELPDEFVSFHWHGDTFDLPTNSIHLFKSEACDRQGFLYKNNVLGVQFHPEVEEDLLNNLTVHDKSELVLSPFIQSEIEMKKLLPKYIEAQHQHITNLIEAFVHLK
ncbi:MAG: type 1 glutamine amidotransferase [Ferruginibacter sp.]